MGYLILENFEFPDVSFKQACYLRSRNVCRRYDFFKIIIQGQEQFHGVRVGVCLLGANVVADLVKSLQVYLGDLVVVKYLQFLKIFDFLRESLEGGIGNFPVKGQDNGFELT